LTKKILNVKENIKDKYDMESRYYLHISSNENRESILENGLVPKAVIESKQFDKEQREELHASLGEPKIFGVPMGNDLDAYDIIDVRNRVFPVPLIVHGFTDEEYEEIVQEGKEDIDFDGERARFKSEHDERMRGNEHQQKIASFGYSEDMMELERRLNSRINKICISRAKNFDIWLIDNKIAMCEWEEDPHGYDDTVGDEAYMTNKAIPVKALELVATDNMVTRSDMPNENLNHLISFEKFNLGS